MILDTANKHLDEAVKAHEEYWLASERYGNVLIEMEKSCNKSDETLQRLRCMRTKLIADRYQIEFELNRIVEEINEQPY